MSVPTERERVIAQFTHGDSCGCSYCVHSREVIIAAYHAGYQSGYKAGHDAAIEQAAQELETFIPAHVMDLFKRKAAAIRALKQPVEAEEKA